VIAVGSSLPNVVIDSERGDDASAADPVGFMSDFGWVLGSFEDASDVDVYSFDVPAGDARLLQATRMPTGSNGYGSTAEGSSVWVTTAAGDAILARSPLSENSDEIGPPLVAGSYLLWVTDTGAAGSNDFYVFKVGRGLENSPEAEPNDTVGEATPITLTPDAEGTRHGFLLFRLTSTTDIDYASFSASPGDEVTIACTGARSGSGVVGLSVELRGPTDTVITSKTESLTEDLSIAGETLVASGSHYLRVAKTGQVAEVTGDFVRCGIHVTPST
jgi:hypothetical protein